MTLKALVTHHQLLASGTCRTSLFFLFLYLYFCLVGIQFSVFLYCVVLRERTLKTAPNDTLLFFFSLNASLHFILFFFRLTLPLSFSLPQLSRIVGAVRHRRQRDHSVPPHQKCVILLACPCLLFPSSFTVVLLLLLLLFYKQRFIYISPLDCN